MNNREIIVLDLEFNPVFDPEIKPAICNEIIEIGAVMLDDSLNIRDRFDIYIKPVHNEITPIITSITGITNETVSGSPSFEEAIKLFYEWCGDSPRFYTWSNADRNVLLSEMKFKLGEDAPLFDKFNGYWVDLQKIFGKIMGLRKSMGLANALGVMEVKFSGTEHGALADAENTALVLKMLRDKPMIKRLKARTNITYNQSTSSGGFSIGSLFAEQLSKLTFNEE